MNKKMTATLFVILGLIVLVAAPRISGAQETPVSIKGAVDVSVDRNPFQPQIPLKIEKPKKPEPQQQQKIKPKVPTARPVTKPTFTVPQKPQTPKAEPKQLDLKITGLVWNTSRPQAIINDQVVDVGDKVDEAIIVAINKTGIEVSYEGKTTTITP